MRDEEGQKEDDSHGSFPETVTTDTAAAPQVN